jgi:hypothetical protein
MLRTAYENYYNPSEPMAIDEVNVRTFVNVETVTEDVEIGSYVSWWTRDLD